MSALSVIPGPALRYRAAAACFASESSTFSAGGGGRLRKLFHQDNGTQPSTINPSWLTTNSISHLNAASMKPYECSPMPSMFTPNQDQLVTMLPKMAQLIRPRS